MYLGKAIRVKRIGRMILSGTSYFVHWYGMKGTEIESTSLRITGLLGNLLRPEMKVSFLLMMQLLFVLGPVGLVFSLKERIIALSPLIVLVLVCPSSEYGIYGL